MARQYFDENYDEFLSHAEIKSKDLKYGLPDQKKYPMPDRSHVLSAIKFFNYVSPKDEETLANAILARMEEYGITDVNVGPDNRFKKYYEKTELKHYGTPGMRKGHRRYQTVDGSRTAAGHKRYDTRKVKYIDKLMAQGYPRNQAVAIAYRLTERDAGIGRSGPVRIKNKSQENGKHLSLRSFLEEQVAREGLTGKRAAAQVRYRQKILKEKGADFIASYIESSGESYEW